MSESLKHFIPQFVLKKEYGKIKTLLSLALFIQIITALIIAGFFFFWAPYISLNYFKNEAAIEVLKIFAFFFVGISIFQTISQFFLAVQDTFSHKIIEVLRMGFVMLSILYMFFWDIGSLQNYSYSWIIWLYIGLIIAMSIFYTHYFKKYLYGVAYCYDPVLIKKVLWYAGFVLLWSSAWTILGQMDMQMIIFLLWPEEAWYYTNYLSIVWIPFVILTPIFMFLFPVISELHSQGQTQRIYLIKKIFSENFILIWIMGSSFFWIFSEALAYILFWEKFVTSGTILQYSILLVIFNFLLQINFNILAWIWQVQARVKIMFFALIFNFIMNYALLKMIWVYWAALATSFGWVLIFIMSEYFLWKKYFVKLSMYPIFKNILLFTAIGITSSYAFGDILLEFSRWYSLLWLIWFFIIWLWFFIWVNYQQTQYFISEIKKLRNNA